MTLACFQTDGTELVVSARLKRILKGSLSSSTSSIRIRGLTPSGPGADSGLSLMSLSFTRDLLIGTERRGGNVLFHVVERR